MHSFSTLSYGLISWSVEACLRLCHTSMMKLSQSAFTFSRLANFLKLVHFLLHKIRKRAMSLVEAVMIDQSQHGKPQFKGGEKNQLLEKRALVYRNHQIKRR